MQRILEPQKVQNPEPIQTSEYQTRRELLLRDLPPGCIAIVKGQHIHHRNHDSEYPFRQNSDFYYLCGFSEPDAVLVLLKPSVGTEKNSKETTQVFPKTTTQAPPKTTTQGTTEAKEKSKPSKNEFILFCNSANPEEERWTGKRAGIAGAIKQFSADRAYDIKDLDKIMPLLMTDTTHCFYSLGVDRKFDDRVLSWMDTARAQTRKGGEYPKRWEDIAPHIHELRVIKSESEIQLMQKAADISVSAHLRLMKFCRPDIMEYQLEGEFLHECIQKNARFLAYPSIVGGGNNSCVLHYTANNHALQSGDLLLVDAGCEYENYASDITRTYPVNGRFSQEQKKIYELVLKAQQTAIELIRPGVLWNALQNAIIEVLVKGLVDLKILQGDVTKLIENKAYLPFYMHSSGHWLGLDVHDAGAYKINGEWRPLEAGMVLTVEPGLYISQESPSDKKWWGIGVRIEDDVLVTQTGYKVLTETLPKTVQDIESIMQQKS